MKSNIINITKHKDNLAQILKETQKTAVYAELNAKETIRAQLIAEELIGMLNELSGDFSGEFWLEKEDCTLNYCTKIALNENMDKKTKRKFIDVSSDKKNAAAKGVMGKIRDVVENLLYPENAVFSSKFISYDLEMAALRDDRWTLSKYKDAQRNNPEPWDELEKSIIANLADDVSVGVKGNNVEIVVTKSFSKKD